MSDDRGDTLTTMTDQQVTPAPVPAPDQSGVNPSLNPAVVPQVQAPQVPQAPQAQPTNDVHPNTGLYNQILNTLSPRVPVRDAQGNPVTDPSGQIQTRQAGVKSLGASILAGALASMAASFQHMPEYKGKGTGYVSNQNESAAAGVAAGAQYSPQGMRDTAQKQANEQRLRRYSTFQQNTDMHTMEYNAFHQDREQKDAAVADWQPFVTNVRTGGLTVDGKNQYDPSLDHMGMGELTKAIQSRGDLVANYTIIPAEVVDTIDPTTGKQAHEVKYLALNNHGMIKVTPEMREQYPILKHAGPEISAVTAVQIGQNAYSDTLLDNTFSNLARAQSEAFGKQGDAPQKIDWKGMIAKAGFSPADKQKLHMLGGNTDRPDVFLQKLASISPAAAKMSEDIGQQLGVNATKWEQKTKQDEKAGEAQVKITSVASDQDADAVRANPTKYSPDIVAAANKWHQDKVDTEVNKEARIAQNKGADEDRRQGMKDARTPVYAVDANGQTILSNKNDHPEGEEMKAADINKDRQAMRQLNDVQTNTSRYTNAASVALKTPPTSEDYVNMHSLLNKAGALDLNVAIGEGGSIKIPVLSGMIEGLNREVTSEAYAGLSPQAKGLIDGYIRTMASIPAYQKALTGIGRSNKEMLDLELANIANPTMKPADILRKQGQFQENIKRATEGFPNNLPGIKHPAQTQNEMENPQGSDPAAQFGGKTRQ